MMPRMSIDAMIDSEGWCRCGKCGHKLFNVKDWGYGTGNGFVTIEIKCHSCKQINEISLYS